MNQQELKSLHEFFEGISLKETNEAATKLAIKLVNYIEKEFKVDRLKATFTAGVLIASIPAMIEENNGVKEGVQGIIDDLENEKNDFTNS